MNLKFGVLADYAGQGAAGKTILVGIFDTLFNPQRLPSFNSPPFFLFAAIEGHVTEGTEHRAVIHFTTGDGQDLPVPVRVELPITLGARGPGRDLAGNLFIGLQGLPLPGNGSYEFNILIDGRHVGSIPLYVAEPVPAS